MGTELNWIEDHGPAGLEHRQTQRKEGQNLLATYGRPHERANECAVNEVTLGNRAAGSRRIYCYCTVTLGDEREDEGMRVWIVRE